ncbi:MAG: UvrD-helicase domain-containing protein [Candidatus Eremiobacteraeota bacterium]|nr:UvrD-helicase domain-containing protein [Candidatus Eremiobacteraeota bacterium]
MLATARADATQSRVIAHPPTAGSLSVRGAAGSGKTFALVARAHRLALEHRGTILVTAPSDAGVARLREGFGDDAAARLAPASFGDIALRILREHCGRDVDAIDDITASMHFERAGAALFALDWTEFVSADIDPEITGLRAPERFSAAAFRLIRKLRAALVSPDDFRIAGLRGATAFYANPPNLADAALLAETPGKYRDSLRVSAAELERQREREVDLVRILARLYASYVDVLVSNGCLTPTDAVYEAALALRARPDVRLRARETYAAILVDNAQDLSAAQLALVEGIAADGMSNVTFAGDEAQNTRSFAGGGRGVAALKQAATTHELDGRFRCAPAIERAARSVLDPKARGDHDRTGDPAVVLYRAGDAGDEARYVAEEVLRLIARGTPPERIALLKRNVRCAGVYIDALLARGIEVEVAGSASLFDFPVVGDALGALWSAVDPYRHDFLLRVLASPWLRLNDASLAILCGDAPQAQALLFPLPDDVHGARAGRWDRRRDVRLGRNVVRGDVDAELSGETRQRLASFRAARDRWEALARTLEPCELVQLVLDETVLATSSDDARGRFERRLIARLITMFESAAVRDPLASLYELLQYFERVTRIEDDLLALGANDAHAVMVLDVEAAKGSTFDAVFAVDVRAGAWPRYYTPDAFLFMPSAGMIPKENVGDARAARTAKFTYALHAHKLRDKYAAEDRRALYTAMTRASAHLSISASGRPTRGLGTPEFLEELLGHQ